MIITGDQGTVDAHKALENLRLFRVTTPCFHPMDIPLPVSKNLLSDNTLRGGTRFRDSAQALWCVISMPIIPVAQFYPLREQSGTLIYLYPTTNHPLSQWAALTKYGTNHGDQPLHATTYLFQLNACLSCTKKSNDIPDSPSKVLFAWDYKKGRHNMLGKFLVSANTSYYHPPRLAPFSLSVVSILL